MAINDGDTVWVCGKVTDELPGGGRAWELRGVYDTEDKAKAAAQTPWYFIGPHRLNETNPHEQEEWEGAYYPLADEIGDWTEEELIKGERNA